jgi:hypothetical protein
MNCEACGKAAAPLYQDCPGHNGKFVCVACVSDLAWKLYPGSRASAFALAKRQQQARKNFRKADSASEEARAA